MADTAEIINFPEGLTLSGKYAAGVPIEATSQLSHLELKVYVSLCSFAGKDNKCYPKRKNIAEIIYAKDWNDITEKQQENRLNLISKVLRSLSKGKWIKIDGDGRYGKPNDYTITSRRTPIVKTQGVVNAQPVVKVQGQPVVKVQGQPVVKVQGQASKPLQPTNSSEPSISIPDFINSETLDGFKAMRKRIKKPLTERAEKMLITKLTGFYEKGFCPNKILEVSEFNCWQDVFEPKNKQQFSRNKSTRENFDLKDYGETQIPSWMEE